ncbi:MAG: hypothetical protein EXR92_02440 [Gemmatimonadetes bacterium]|nr:hypothetical protein [Gemmatimonadota bacterium]
MVIGLSAVIVAVTKESPRILTIAAPSPRSVGAGRSRVGANPARGRAIPRRTDAMEGSLASARDGAEGDVLPYGPLDPEADRTFELTLRRWVRERTGLDLGYVEQLYTFGDRDRSAQRPVGAPKVISVAYLALVREDRPTGPDRPRWRDWYTFFPWEDWRQDQPEVIRRTIAPALSTWAAQAPRGSPREERRERAGIAFGLEGAGWDADRVLDRYELLYEVGLVREAHRDRKRAGADPTQGPGLGHAMDMDHRRILATGLGRIRGKLRYRPVVFELLPGTFTLLRLQTVVEALVGLRLHKQNFRRLVESGGLVEGTGKLDSRTGGRPAEIFRFRREVLRERRAPGVVLPGSR